MYKSGTLRYPYVFIECVFNTVWESIFLLFIHKTYNIPIILLQIPTTKKFDHLKVTWFLLSKKYVTEVCMLCGMTCP